MTEESMDSLWTKCNEFPILFDDFSKGDVDDFFQKFLNPSNIFIDIGPGVGLAAGFACRPRLDMVLHLVMFDRRLRGREPIFLNIMGYFFEKLQLQRMTAMIPEDARTSVKLVQRLGFTEEGRMRQAILRDGKYIDMFLYGILREEFNATART